MQIPIRSLLKCLGRRIRSEMQKLQEALGYAKKDKEFHYNDVGESITVSCHVANKSGIEKHLESPSTNPLASRFVLPRSKKAD